MKKKFTLCLVSLMAVVLLCSCGLSREEKARKRRNEKFLKPVCMQLLDEDLGQKNYKLEKLEQGVDSYLLDYYLTDEFDAFIRMDDKKFRYRFITDDNLNILDRVTDMHMDEIKSEVWNLIKKCDGMDGVERADITVDAPYGENLLEEHVRTLYDLQHSSFEDCIMGYPSYDLKVQISFFEKKDFDPRNLNIWPIYEKIPGAVVEICNYEGSNELTAEEEINRLTENILMDRIFYDQLTYYLEDEESGQQLIARYEHNTIKNAYGYKLAYNDHFYDALLSCRDGQLDVYLFPVNFAASDTVIPMQNGPDLHLYENNDPSACLHWGSEFKDNTFIHEKVSQDMYYVREIDLFGDQSENTGLHTSIKVQKKELY